MEYFLFLLFFCLVVGVVAVASNPSPYFGAAGLMMSAGFGCAVLVWFGGSFLSLVLFLIYLGGMLVVFAYSVALSSDMFPEGIMDWSVGAYFLWYIGVLMFFLYFFGTGLFCSYGVVGGEAYGLDVFRGDFNGVSLLYGGGGAGLLACGWGLFLTLFVVLELTRGLSRGGLRAV